MIEDEFAAAIANERQDALAAGRLFARACRDGDVDSMLAATDIIAGTCGGWRHAMRHVGRITAVSEEIQSAFLSVWIEHKMLPLAVGHRPTLARALRILMPQNYSGPPIKVYRGAASNERRRRLYGFSWTTDREIARRFALNRQALPAGAIVLETVAAPSAILLMREDENYYDEREVVVDPFELGNVQVIEKLLTETHHAR